MRPRFFENHIPSECSCATARARHTHAHEYACDDDESYYDSLQSGKTLKHKTDSASVSHGAHCEDEFKENGLKEDEFMEDELKEDEFKEMNSKKMNSKKMNPHATHEVRGKAGLLRVSGRMRPLSCHRRADHCLSDGDTNRPDTICEGASVLQG